MRTFKYSRILDKRRKTEITCKKEDHDWGNMVRAGQIHEGTTVLQCKQCWMLFPVRATDLIAS